jgi:hypothetical protein
MSNTQALPVDPLLPNSKTQAMKALLGTRPTVIYPRPQPEPFSFTEEVETVCQDCNGSGIDLGGLKEYEPEDCRFCKGTGKETVTRNWLNEALAIVHGQSDRPPERKHLEALYQQNRTVTNAYCETKARETEAMIEVLR